MSDSTKRKGATTLEGDVREEPEGVTNQAHALGGPTVKGR
jgi:hypothetical protein